jgi:hypothetical protein
MSSAVECGPPGRPVFAAGLIAGLTANLLGPANWYLPRWLAWLPRVSADDAIPAAPRRARAPRAARHRPFPHPRHS